MTFGSGKRRAQKKRIYHITYSNKAKSYRKSPSKIKRRLRKTWRVRGIVGTQAEYIKRIPESRNARAAIQAFFQNTSVKRKILFLQTILLCFIIIVQSSIFTLPVDAKNDEQNSIDAAKLLQEECRYLASLQLQSGAIVMYKEPNEGLYKYNPYFACFSAMALLERKEYTGAVRRYIDYHIKHLNEKDKFDVKGTIYDYYIDAKTSLETPTYDYDSSDSYAAMFLELLRVYYEKTGDKNYLSDKKHILTTVADAMLSTLDNGLTQAKPGYGVKYLMDNCEVVQGLSAAETLLREVYKDESLADKYKRERLKIVGAIEKQLWNKKNQTYHYALTKKGGEKTDTLIFYPDGVSQIFPIIFDVIDPNSARAKLVYKQFDYNHSGWTSLYTGDAYPWAMIAYCAIKMKDHKQVEDYLKLINSKYLKQGHPYPWYCGESAFVILTAAEAVRQKYAAN